MGCHFLLQCMKVKSESEATQSCPTLHASVVSDSVQPQRRQPTSLPCPWDSPGKNTGVGCHFLLQLLGLGSYPGEGDGYQLQHACLVNPLDRGAWWAVVLGVARSQTRLSNFTFMHWRRKWQPTPVFLPGESQGQGRLVGCRLWGHTESDMTEAT